MAEHNTGTPRTESDLLTNSFQDGQGNNSISSQDMRDLVVSTKYLNTDGWDFHFDDEYTLASKRSIAAGVRTKVTINGNLANLGHPPIEGNGHQHFWDDINNKIIPNGLNNFGMVRLAMTGWSDGAGTNHFDVELDVSAGSFPIIYRQTAEFVKGASTIQHFNFVIPLFSGPDFQANGGEFYITPLADASFWEFAITAAAVYGARP